MGPGDSAANQRTQREMPVYRSVGGVYNGIKIGCDGAR